MNLHNNIRQDFGHDNVKLVRDLENCAKKVARFRNHLRFNVHCKHHHVTPVSLRLKSTVQGPDAKKILRSAERRFLKVRIGQNINRIDKLITEKASLTTKIMQVFHQETFTQVEEFVLKSQLCEHEVTKERQKNKFSCLLNTSGMNSNQPTSVLASECMQKWVTNCSQRILSDPELSVWKKGLNFAVTPKKLPVVDLIAATESACRYLNSSDANELRAKVVSTIGKHGNINDQNITKKERKAIEDFRKDENIMILPADKDRTTVVMDKQEYLNKCNSMLQDTKTYKHDPTAKYKRELAALLKDLKDREVISNTLRKRLYPTSDQPPRFYGVPKTHKINMQLRPIVSTIGSITYEVDKYLAEVLSPLVGQTEFHVKNSKDFAESITGLKIEADEELRSYDITALFTSVQIDKALAIIRSKLMEDSLLADKTVVPKLLTIGQGAKI